MIFLFHLRALRAGGRLFPFKTGNSLSIRLPNVKLPQIPKTKKPTKIQILPASLLPGFVLTVTCSSKKNNIIGDNELSHLSDVINDETLDWWNLLKILNPDAWRMIIAILAAIIVAVINVQLPINLGRIVDVLTSIASNAEGGSFLAQLKDPAIKLFSLYVFQALFTFIYIDFISTIGENIACNLKKSLFESVMQQDLMFFDVHRTGEIIDRLTSDIQEFKSAFKLCISQGIRSSTQIFGCFVSLITVSPEMTAVMFGILPIIFFVGSMLGTKLRKISKDAQEAAAWTTIIAEEMIANIRTVRAFAMEKYECEKFEKQIQKTSEMFKRLGFGIALFQAGSNVFLNGIVLLTLGLGGYMLSMKKLSAGNIMAFLVAMQTIEKSLTQISLLFGHFVKGIASGTRVFQFISLSPKVPLSIDTNRIIPSDAFHADVEFEGINFSYPTRSQKIVLKDFNLTIPAGKVAAIVGASGNGKSTVAALLLKFYKVNKGQIRISGKDIEELDENWLRKKVIGFINQEPVLFATTIKENIRYGNPDALDEEVYNVSRLANADEFIQQFPAGYDTLVGERGTAISGGQKQRIAIARALLKKPLILILDEATSALDTISEQEVQKSLESVMKGRTVLVIAHRLSTIKNADIIVVLDGGSVVEVGKHDELVKKKGFYWNLMNRQGQIKLDNCN